MSAHTQGPWLKDGLVIIAPDGSSLGEMSAGHPYIKVKEQAANARLAAAAPDLLHALEMVRDANRDDPHIPTAALACIDAAIAKAQP